VGILTTSNNQSIDRVSYLEEDQPILGQYFEVKVTLFFFGVEGVSAIKNYKGLINPLP
jgi:hypothetical protein